ncbi:hypothetical protein F4553_005664 [Allocatelliglobosispora scoriae]|uniref:Uncharacterized protein n=1 Tax=Allocatelliglobosispora scoriae TaxID=643052 RepID=A0A841BZU6_9ACTN|nr:hypothetical protein [Allocatelliglobosispora scoriae]
MPARECSDHLAGADARTGRDARHHRFVGGAQAARVGDADHSPAGEATGEDDDPGTGRDNGRSRRGGEVDAAVAGEPGLGRREELPDHGGRAAERPAEAVVGCRGTGEEQQDRQQKRRHARSFVRA